MHVNYYSKVILFGEYSMIFDSIALMIPLKRFSAQWRFTDRDKPESIASNRSLSRFLSYLAQNEELSCTLDLQRFRVDLDHGLHLDSNVPSSYGLGSSGTLVAAVYDAYALQKTDDLMDLKRLFGIMESFFHGSSSGIDPLQCYLGEPFKISSEGITRLGDDFLKKDIHVCLIDTKVKSKTGPLVEYFKRQRQDEVYLKGFQTEYVPLVSRCIETMISGNTETFFETLGELSQKQMKFLRPMITDNTIDLFLEKPDFHFGVKISGSGGGGYLLGFTNRPEQAETLLSSYEICWID